jgi:ketosteroid isomerase-like protein
MAKTSLAVGLIALLLPLVACGKPPLEEKEAIRNLITDYAEAVNEVDDLLSLCSWDAVLIPQGSSARVGKQAIQSYFEERSSQSSIQLRMNLVDIVLRRGWALAYTEDSWHVTRKASGISDSFDTRSLLVLRQDDYGEWRLAGHMWSQDE